MEELKNTIFGIVNESKEPLNTAQIVDRIRGTGKEYPQVTCNAPNQKGPIGEYETISFLLENSLVPGVKIIRVRRGGSLFTIE